MGNDFPSYSITRLGSKSFSWAWALPVGSGHTLGHRCWLRPRGDGGARLPGAGSWAGSLSVGPCSLPRPWGASSRPSQLLGAQGSAQRGVLLPGSVLARPLLLCCDSAASLTRTLATGFRASAAQGDLSLRPSVKSTKKLYLSLFVSIPRSCLSFLGSQGPFCGLLSSA